MNIKNVMMMAAMMPAVALAETNSNSAPASVEANDTTIRVNDQNIVIKQDGEQTSVKIYKMNGNEMTKISETQFVDGQEVEKVFVTSPVSASAFPTKWHSPPLSPSDRYTTISRTIMY